jgi:hypothetical protein
MQATRRLSGALALLLAMPGEALAAQAPAPAPAPPPAAEATQPADEVGPASDTADTDANIPVIARAGLEIDTSGAGPAGPVLMSRLEELGNLELRRAEILPRRTGEDPVIRVRVELRGQEGDTYAITSEVAVRGATLEGSPREIVCSLCTEGEAVERARSELLRLVPFVRARFRGRTDAKPKPDPAPGPAPAPRDTRPGTAGKVGIGLLAGGALAFGTGLGLALVKPRPDPDDPLRAIDTRPAGYGVLAVGVAAIVTGAVLVILDRRPARRLARLAPLLHPTTTGLQVVGRF